MTQAACGQTFLDAYKSYRLERADKVSNAKARKSLRKFIKSHIIEIDTVFKSYKARTAFDFNTADTLFLVYNSPAESPFTSDVIIWSGNDTISYRQAFETIQPFRHKRIMTYEPFIPKSDKPDGSVVVTERDSLLTLVAKRDFNTIDHLGDNQSINGGSYFSIYIAIKDKGRYKIEACFPRQFMIRELNRVQ